LVGIAGVVGVLGADAPGEIGSTLDQNAVTLIGSAPQVMRHAAGRSIASPELLAIVSRPNESNGLVWWMRLPGGNDRSPTRATSLGGAGLVRVNCYVCVRRWN